ncbi:hypothetical protein F2Q69_00061806 [Brassica cretica]|uniref:Uncharacterized protein n=1 Tax=Brassica cretica TaxID=69181 RepID=A0A8S9RMD7_BRACR|nr:hypothetical protein F2Q69_00061806 [Brassica cretica]
MLSSIARGQFHSLLILFCLPFPLCFLISLQLSSLLTYFVALPFAMITTLGLHNVFVRVYAMWVSKAISGLKLILLFRGVCGASYHHGEKNSPPALVLPRLLRRQYWLILFFLRFRLMLRTASPWLGQILVVFDVVFLVVGLPSIVFARLGFQDQVFGDLTSMLSFIARGQFYTLPFAMLTTLGLHNVFVRVYVMWAVKVISGLKLIL